MTAATHRPVPRTFSADKINAFLVLLANKINELLDGRSNNIGSFVLAAGTTTTVTDRRVGSLMTVLVTPMDSTAQTAAAYISSVTDGSFVVTHTAGKTDGAFRYAVIG